MLSLEKKQGYEKIFLIIVSLVLFASCDKSPDVGLTIKDEIFKKYCYKSFDKNHNGKLSQEECDMVTEIDCSDRDISSLDGIELFRNLEYLDCSDNKISCISLGSLKYLLELNCASNNLDSLDVSLNNLVKLKCSRNNLKKVVGLQNSVALETLSCEKNYLEELDLKDNEVLNKLYCHGNALKIINVSRCKLLYVLWCQYNQLESIDVSGCYSLSWFDCRGNALKELDLTHNSKLQQLACGYNQLQSLDIRYNRKLFTLDLGDMNLSQVSMLPKSEKYYEEGFDPYKMPEHDMSDVNWAQKLMIGHIGDGFY